MLTALAKFKVGDRVEYPERKWIGTVTKKVEEIAWIYGDFEGVGMAGCDPRHLVHAGNDALKKQSASQGS